MSGGGHGVLPGVLIDAQTDAGGLEKRCVDVVGVTVSEEIAQDVVHFNGGSFFQVSVHGRGEIGALSGDCLVQESDEGWWERESAGGGHCCAFVESPEHAPLSVGDRVDFAYGAVEEAGDKTE